MISALTTCPFDSHYATVLEMTGKLESMLDALGARPLDRDPDLDIDIARHFGKLPPTPKEPHQEQRPVAGGDRSRPPRPVGLRSGARQKREARED